MDDYVTQIKNIVCYCALVAMSKNKLITGTVMYMVVNVHYLDVT